MKVQVTAKFFLDNGEVKRVDWFEIDPKLIGKIVENGVDKPIEIILKSAKDVQDEYKRYSAGFIARERCSLLRTSTEN